MEPVMEEDEPVLADSERLQKTLDSIDGSLTVIKFWVMTWSLLFAGLLLASMMCNRKSPVEFSSMGGTVSAVASA
jgi:hypothetical protein